MANYKMSTYTIDRKTASRLLKVSMRTVDRHIKLKHISSKAIGGRIWLNKDQIIDFRNRQRVKGVLSIDSYVDTIDTNVDKLNYMIDENGHRINIKDVDSEIGGEVKSRGKIMDESIDSIYKSLYEKLIDEFKEKQTQLSSANYKIGQLEARLKYSISLIEYKKAQALLLSNGENLKKQLENEKKGKVGLYDLLTVERLNKRIYLILAIILILLQPLWLLFLVW